ncbi:MAG TPA: hypothetical protein VFS62_05340 [Chloroflexota bacterium]|nr:hypothetical protein [Chloroflexota bacterium]
MTAIPFVIGLAVVTLLFFVLANLRGTKDVLSAAVLLRFYLHIASFVTLVVLVSGLIYLATGLMSLGSMDFSYSRPVYVAPIGPPGTSQNQQNADQERQQVEQQGVEHQKDSQATDLIRGGTLTVIGGLLFGLHIVLRHRQAQVDGPEIAGNFLRGYLIVGLITFGVVGLVALPIGVYQALKFVLLTPLPTQERVAPGNTLSTGIILTPLWVFYLLGLMRQARRPTAEPLTAA